MEEMLYDAFTVLIQARHGGSQRLWRRQNGRECVWKITQGIVTGARCVKPHSHSAQIWLVTSGRFIRTARDSNGRSGNLENRGGGRNRGRHVSAP